MGFNMGSYMSRIIKLEKDVDVLMTFKEKTISFMMKVNSFLMVTMLTIIGFFIVDKFF